MTRRFLSLFAAGAVALAAGPALALSVVTHLTPTLTAAPVHYVGHCPGVITFHGKVFVAGHFQPGSTVEIGYQFSRSDGATGPNQFFSVSGPGPHDIVETWTLGGAQLPHVAGWEHYKVWVTDSAQGGQMPPKWSNEAHFTLVCH